MSARARVCLNRQRLNDLRKAHGIQSEAQMAEILAVSPSALWRITNQQVTPSVEFIARALTAFPHVELKVLFRIETARAI